MTSRSRSRSTEKDHRATVRIDGPEGSEDVSSASEKFFRQFFPLAKKPRETFLELGRFSGRRRLHVLDLDQDDIAVLDPLHDLVDVLLEVMRGRFLQLLVDQDVDGVLRGGAEALTDAAVMRQGIVAADLRVLGQFAGHARAVQGAAPKFEDESLHGASLYAGSAPQAETACTETSLRLRSTEFIPFARKTMPRMNSVLALPKTAFPATMKSHDRYHRRTRWSRKEHGCAGLGPAAGLLLSGHGTMYRAVALAGLQAGVDRNRPEQLAELAPTCLAFPASGFTCKART